MTEKTYHIPDWSLKEATYPGYGICGQQVQGPYDWFVWFGSPVNCIPCLDKAKENLMADNIKGIPFSSDDEGIDFPTKAKMCVLHNYNEFGIGTPRGEKINELALDEVYVVWFAFVRGNWKALLSTSRADGRIYEVSYKRENDGSDGPESLVCDTYLKTHNTVMDDMV